MVNQSLGPVRPYHTHNGTNFNCHDWLCAGPVVDDDAPEREKAGKAPRPKIPEHPLVVKKREEIELRRLQVENKELKRQEREVDEALKAKKAEEDAAATAAAAAAKETETTTTAVSSATAPAVIPASLTPGAGNTAAPPDAPPAPVKKAPAPATKATKKKAPIVPAVPKYVPKAGTAKIGVFVAETDGTLNEVAKEKTLAQASLLNALAKDYNARPAAAGVPRDDEVEERPIGDDEIMKLAMAGKEEKKLEEAGKEVTLKEAPKKKKMVKAKPKAGRRRC